MMLNEKLSLPESSEVPEPSTPAVDWADLRAQAAKLGISLSELQQRDREKKLRLARKTQSRPHPPATVELIKP